MDARGIGDAEGFPIGDLQPAGEFSYDRREQRWEWSEEMYRIHGFVPGEVVPTTALLLRHKEPGAGTVGREQVMGAIESGKPRAFWHRIVDAAGRVRSVVTVWKGIRDEGTGEVVRIQGYMMDVTRGVRRDASSAVSAAFEHRAVIDQAKGMLMLVHGISADAAFGLLQNASCETNTKLHALAERLVEKLGNSAGEHVTERLVDLAGQVLGNGHRPEMRQVAKD
ncbi:MAG TPA: PAS and ANTAR domain-containing protein [Nocardioidaceae bacterium]